MTTVSVLPGGNGEMPEPDWGALFSDELLQSRARETWRLTTQEMRDAGTLAPVNAGQLRRYVMAQVLYEDAAAKVAEQGALKIGRTGKATYNLWFAILKDTDTMASNHEDKLGLNPRRRAQVTPAKRKQRAATAADSYLGRSGTKG
jgi:phage terminase small subunit